MSEAYVQVALDSIGKKVRTLEVTENGQTVEIQVIALADLQGLLPYPVAALGMLANDPNAIAGQFTSGVATPVTVGNFPATQPVSGTVAVSNLPGTQPVSGAVTATQGTTPWVVDDSAVLQTLIDVDRQILQQLSTLTLMFAAVFSPNVDLGGLMKTAIAPVVTN